MWGDSVRSGKPHWITIMKYEDAMKWIRNILERELNDSNVNDSKEIADRQFASIATIIINIRSGLIK